MEFGDYQSYAGFNDEVFFAGTVQAANKAGFDLNMSLKGVGGNQENATISKPDLYLCRSIFCLILHNGRLNHSL